MMRRIKQNVILFTTLAIGAAFILYGTEVDKSVSTEKLQLDNISSTSHETLKSSHHSRSLLAQATDEGDVGELEVTTTLNSVSRTLNNMGNTKPEVSRKYSRVKGDKISRRRKREVPRSNELFAWKFNLNVTRYEDGASKTQLKYPPSGQKEKSKNFEKGKNKNHGMAMYVEGNGPKQSFEELYQAWDSVGTFLREVFGGNLEELKEKGHDVSLDASALPNQTGQRELPSESFIQGSGEEPQTSRGKEGKFLFGLLNFGGNKENPPLDEGSGEALETQELNLVTELTTNSQVIENQSITETIHVLKTTEMIVADLENRLTPSPEQLEKFVTSSLVLDRDSILTSITEVVPTVTLIEDNVISDPNKCSNCDSDIESTASTDKSKFIGESSTLSVEVSTVVAPIQISTEPSFSAEEVSAFCIGLFSRMKKSPRFVEEIADFEGSGTLSDENASEGTVKTENSNSGFFSSIWNRITGRRIVPVQDETSNDNRGARILNFNNIFGGFGSGRSAEVNEFSNIEFDNISTEGTPKDLEGVLSVEDCETFFRRIQTETKPNLFDIMFPNAMNDLTNHELTTHSGDQRKFNENEAITNLNDIESTSQVEIIAILHDRKTDQPNNIEGEIISSNLPVSEINLTTEQQDNRLVQDGFENEDGKSLLEETSELDIDSIQDRFENKTFNIHNLVLENTIGSHELSSTEKIDIRPSTNAFKIEQNTEQSNDMRTSEDGRFFNILGFGSGADDEPSEGSSDFSNDNESRFFGGLINFGSGERGIKETDISTPNTEMMPESSQRFFPDLLNFGSGERVLDKSTIGEDENEIFTSTNTAMFSGRFFGFGSGEREFSESTEFITADRNMLMHEISIASTQSIIIESHLTKEKSDEAKFTTPDRTDVALNAHPTLDRSTEINDIKDRRFLGFLNIAGSGDERELPETAGDAGDINCEDCLTSLNTSISTVECDNCQKNLNESNKFLVSFDNEDASEVPVEDYEVRSEHPGQVSVSQPSNQYMSSTINFPLEQYKTDGGGQKDHYELIGADKQTSEESNVKDSDYVTTDGPVRTSHETTTVDNKQSKFLGTIFLTGSGEGGLFVDNKGPINLVQEAEFTSPPSLTQPSQPRRGARLNDDLSVWPPEETEKNIEVTKPNEASSTEIIFENSEKPTESQSQRGARFHDPPVRPRQKIERIPVVTKSNALSSTAINLEITKSNSFSSTEVNLEVSDKPTDDNRNTSDRVLHQTETDVVSFGTNYSVTTSVEPTQTFQNEFIETLNTSSEDTAQENETSVTVTTVDALTSTTLTVTPRRKTTESPQKFCTSASQCNSALNERCNFNGSTAICNCQRSFVRHPETGKCEAPVTLKTTLKFPGESFHQDLKDRNSDRFHKKKKDSIETMWMLLGEDPELFAAVAGVDVTGFEEGSLVVHWEIVLATDGNESLAQLIQQVDVDLKEAFEDEELLKNTPLNVENAVLLSVSNEIDPCEKSELNYCSKDAECIRDETRGFKCRCKDEYLDNSSDAKYPGEVCIVTCPAYYCGDHGHCDLKPNGDRHCLCNGWFFGEKCEKSGIAVVAGFASFNVLLIVFVLLLVCFCKRRRYRRSRYYGENQIRFQPEQEIGRFTRAQRLADTIALDEVGPTKASKYMAISTPMHKTPAIHLTSSSILGGSGSSISYDYDSTFDRTPSVGEVNMEVPKAESRLKV